MCPLIQILVTGCVSVFTTYVMKVYFLFGYDVSFVRLCICVNLVSFPIITYTFNLIFTTCRYLSSQTVFIYVEMVRYNTIFGYDAIHDRVIEDRICIIERWCIDGTCILLFSGFREPFKPDDQLYW